MMFDSIAQALGHLLASDGALMVLSMLFGVFVGMLWSGRSFPRRLPRAMVRTTALRR
jgi:uncharacterized membrane protein YeiB